jgi:CRP-like cAMP-binding protein
MPDIDLSTISFFSGFDRDALDKIAAMGETVEAERGAVIMEQGEVGREAFVVVDGEVQIIVNGHVVGTAGRGSLLGEFRKILDDMPADTRAALNERDERFRAENLEIGFDDDRPRPPGH